MIVPFPAGSATDVVARIVTKELSARLRTPLVIENRPGGDTTIGTRALARSQPDGYTIGFAGLTATSIAPSTHKVSRLRSARRIWRRSPWSGAFPMC